ncbi:MAG: DnaA/Hda family protein [Parachlamydiaceae bacterium]|nr:DnaA/Hda family protein [Parachlamydiaceae bacterium]
MQAWEEFLQQQEVDLGRETVEKWLRSLKIQRFDACNLYLEAKDSFQALWFEEHIRGKAHVSLVNGNHKKIKIHLSVANVIEKPGKIPKDKSKSSFNPFNAPFQLYFDELDPHATFDQYIQTEENELTIKLLHEMGGISSNNKEIPFFNPVYIYGPSGSGKTHLLMSLAHAYKAQGLNTIYARAETFTSHVVTAIRAGQMNIFRQAYRNADVLIIDDIHVFSKKGATQEEFFHTFNTLHLENKQIILASNRLPQELQSVEPRLISRFEWGIVLPLKALGNQELERLLKSKQEALNFHLPPKISEFLLESFTSHPKALIKSLEALVLRLHLGQEHTIQGLTIPAVKILINDLLQEEIKSALTPQKIVESAGAHFGIRTEDILGKAQTKECTLPRQISMHFCRHKLKLPFTKIGDIFDRDHSTVMASVRFIQTSLDNGHKDIYNDWHAIEKKLEF